MQPIPTGGIVPPLITPFDENENLDFAALETLVERLVEGQVHGIFALGTTGEGPYLPHAMRHQVIAAVCDQAAGRIPVLVGITDTVVSASIELAEAAYAAGACAAVVAPPYYLPMTQDELRDYTHRLLDASPLPLVLYNMPGCCKTWYDVPTVLELLQDPRVVGLKDSSGDADYFQRVVEGMQGDRHECGLFVGPEERLIESMDAGALGGVHGGANLFPRLYVAMYEAYVAGRRDEAEQLQTMVREVASSLYHLSDGPSSIIKGIKSSLRCLDVCGDAMMSPFTRHTESAREIIRERLASLVPRLGEYAGNAVVRTG